MEAVTSELHAVTAEIRTLVDQIGSHERGTVQTVIHKSSMGGFIAGLAVAACLGSFWYTMDVARTIHNEIRDLTAWKDIYGRDLAAMKQAITQQQEKKP
jgi:hypothetical protein